MNPEPGLSTIFKIPKIFKVTKILKFQGFRFLGILAFTQNV